MGDRPTMLASCQHAGGSAVIARFPRYQRPSYDPARYKSPPVSPAGKRGNTMRVHARQWRLLALLLGLALFAAACGDDDDSTAAAPETTEGGATTTAAGAAGGSGGGVTCDGFSLAFFGALTGDAANLGIKIHEGASLAI